MKGKAFLALVTGPSCFLEIAAAYSYVVLIYHGCSIRRFGIVPLLSHLQAAEKESGSFEWR